MSTSPAFVWTRAFWRWECGTKVNYCLGSVVRMHGKHGALTCAEGQRHVTSGVDRVMCESWVSDVELLAEWQETTKRTRKYFRRMKTESSIFRWAAEVGEGWILRIWPTEWNAENKHDQTFARLSIFIKELRYYWNLWTLWHKMRLKGKKNNVKGIVKESLNRRILWPFILPFPVNAVETRLQPRTNIAWSDGTSKSTNISQISPRHLINK